MITIVYGIQNVKEALAISQAGASGLGFNLSDLSWGQINDIAAQLPKNVMTIVTSHATDMADLEYQCKSLRVNVFHFGSHPDKISPSDVFRLKNEFNQLKFAQVIPVIDQFSIEIAKRYEDLADYLVLDSFNSGSGQLGATGETHDWNISAEIVKKIKIPVILAGGLGPENVGAAIKTVNPWAVASKTRTDLADGKGKDLEKVKAFLEQAKQTE